MRSQRRDPVDERPETPGADEWRARTGLARLLRVVMVVVPLLASWLVVRLSVIVIPRPEEWTAIVAWILFLLIVSMAAHEVARSVVNRLLSLTVLLRVSLTFPDAAPSRLRVAMSAGRSAALESDFADDPSSPQSTRTTKTLAALLTDVTRREGRSLGHGDRVRGYAELIATELGLDDEDRKRLRWATLLHDVGMLDVPDHIVAKRGPLDDDERALVQLHTRHAAARLAPVADWLGEWTAAATDHHERWDGAGYPNGLQGEQIPLAARIVAVADAYDAMTARRSYRRSVPPARAREELVANAGTQFDPAVVRAFLNAGLSERRRGLGPLAALFELPAHLWSLVPRLLVGGNATAGVAAVGAAAISVGVVTAPAISSTADVAPAVERVVETTIIEPTVTEVPTTTSTTTTTTTTSTTTSTTTTTVPTTTTTVPPTTTAPPTTAPPTTTSPPTTTAPPTTTTTVDPGGYPTVPTTAPPSEYPSV